MCVILCTCVRMYVCVMRECMRAFAYVCVRVSECKPCVSVIVRECVRVCVYVCASVCLRACVCACVHAFVCVRPCLCAFV